MSSSASGTGNGTGGAGSSSSASGGGSAAFSRLSRPGSGRLLTAAKGDNASLSWSAGWSNANAQSSKSSRSSSSSSLSPTSPVHPLSSSAGAGLIAAHRVNQQPNTLHFSSAAYSSTTLTSPEQSEMRQRLKISFSQPNIRKASLNLPFFAKAAELSSASTASMPVVEADKRGGAGGPLGLYHNVHSTGKLQLGPEPDRQFDFKAEDLTDQGEIGRGAFGSVNRMVFERGAVKKVMAVKRIRSTVDEREQKDMLMDLDVVVRSSACEFIVKFYGAIFKEGDCWICMELLDLSSDKFYKFVYDKLRSRIPEAVVGKITVATVKALNYLKEKLRIIHRDVKPSNILLGRCGSIKLCDFGISGQLVDSIARTRDAGCRPYMAPERIDPKRAKGYDVRSDVWSLGITLIELSTGCFPYPKWNSVFEQLQQVVHGDPPRLEPQLGFTPEFVAFVNTCLIKDENARPKYTRLLDDAFIKRAEADDSVSVAAYVDDVLARREEMGGAATDTDATMDTVG